MAVEVDIQKVEPTGLPDHFNVGCERKRRVEAFRPSHWKDGVPFTEWGIALWVAQVWGQTGV